MTSAWTISMNHPFLFHKKISQSERALAYSYVINMYGTSYGPNMNALPKGGMNTFERRDFESIRPVLVSGAVFVFIFTFQFYR